LGDLITRVGPYINMHKLDPSSRRNEGHAELKMGGAVECKVPKGEGREREECGPLEVS